MVQKINRKKPWAVQYRDQSGKVKTATFLLKEDALEFEKKITRERSLIKQGLELPREEILLIDYAASWLRRRALRVQNGDLTAGSFEMDDIRLRNEIIPTFGNYPLTTITSRMLREFLDNLQTEKKFKNATRNRYRALLHVLFHDAFMDEKILMNPVSKIPLEKEQIKRITPLSQIEVDLLISAAQAKNPNLGFCFTLMIYEGRRISEAVAMKNQDFDLKNNELHVVRIYEQSTGQIVDRIKGKPEGLVIPLFDRVRIAFEEHLKLMPFKRPADFCICDAEGKNLSTHAVRHHVDFISEKVLKRKVTPHVLRATFATFAEEAGFSKEDIQRMLGHSTVLVTQRYTRRSAGPLLEKAKKLGFGQSNVVLMKKGIS